MEELILVRGDTLKLSIDSIKTQSGEDYVLSPTDIIYVDVKKYAANETPVITKTVTAADYSDGVLSFTIFPEDTAGLAVGEYWFDVRLFIDDDNIYTIVPMSKFRIVQNVTDIPDNGGGG